VESVFAYDASVEWVSVYDFADDQAKIEAMQRATLGPTDFGVSQEPALVGSAEWWRAISEGGLPRETIEGTIASVYWGSMGDWPEFEIRSADGLTSRWTREGDVTRYVVGLRVRLTLTRQRWKAPRQLLGDTSSIVLRVEIEASDRRSDRQAPGPGGVGL
jgi:hypothetical protein